VEDSVILEVIPREVSVEETLHRITVLNGAIDRWKDRPIPEVDRLAYYRPRRISIVYYGGRSYSVDDVVRGLFGVWNTEDLGEIFLRSFVSLGTLLTEEAEAYVTQTLEDYQNGNQLPSFVVAAYKKLVLHK
jgi:hypothetical protein